MNLNDKVEFILNAGATKRFHTLRTIREQTVAEHSFGVAWFCYLLAEGSPSSDLLIAALSHDAAEFVLGDIPSPSKKVLDGDGLLGNMETDILRNFGISTALTENEEFMLKMADILDGMLNCYSERAMGNMFIGECFSRYRDYAEKFLAESSREPRSWTVAADIVAIIINQWEIVING